ncbi:MAG: hypothetical protein POELPBGB_00242 [Bacteroidia bacterium]|nr:hypothetical protein [Bacteroidia bacterium]
MKKITTSIDELYLDTHGILHIDISDGAEITLETTKEHHRAVTENFGTGKFLVLGNLQNSFIITPEARHYAKHEMIDTFHTATAVIGNNPVSRIIVNLFLKLNPPATPFKLFAEEKEATEWLLQQAEQYK